MSKVEFNNRLAELEAQMLIDVGYLKASSLLDYNITEVKLIPYVIEAQELKLEPLIGTSLYRVLQGDNLDYKYRYLLDNHVGKALIHWALSAYLEVAPYQVAEGGVFKHLSTDSESVTNTEVNTMIQRERNKAESYAKRMIDFLELYKGDYPEYTACVSDGLKASRTLKHIGGLNLYNTTYPSDMGGSYRIGDCECGGTIVNSVCGTCGYDSTLFDIATYWGNSNETDITFDYTLLSEQSNTLPNEVIAQPVNDYFWIVSEKDFFIYQMDVKLPFVDFSDPNANTEIFVKDEYNGRFYYRVKIAETYENAVTFDIRLV